jgi:hypothetical protein
MIFTEDQFSIDEYEKEWLLLQGLGSADDELPEQVSKRALPVEGEWVTLPDGRVGRVDHVMTEGVLNLGDVEMPATPDAPVALVSVWEGESFGEPVPIAVADLQAAEEPEAARAYKDKPKRKPRKRKEK